MRALTSRPAARSRTLPAALLTALSVLLLGLLAVPGAPARAATAAAGAGQGCHSYLVPPDTWVVACGHGGGSPGSPGSSGSAGGTAPAGQAPGSTCKTLPIPPAQARQLGLPPPPAAKEWAQVSCPGRWPDPIILISSRGAAPVTPQQLLQVALAELKIPVLKPDTAPPAGKRVLVGLPLWYWIPKSHWRAVQVRIAVGPVWAQVTATPQRVLYAPGGSQAGAACRGPGARFAARFASTTSPCSYTYRQSSDLEPGHAYPAAVSVSWRVSWVGSGGTGGLLRAAFLMAYPFPVRVAEGQSLVVTP
jgi:hypothetical protein